MTHPDDDLLSLLLDGEPVADDDRAHVAGCADCRARLDRLQQAASLVAAPVAPAPAAARQRAIAAALDRAVDARPAAGGTVRPLRRRSRVADWGGPVLAAAAAVVALVVAVPLVTGGDDGDDSGGDVAMSAAAPVQDGDLGELADGTEWIERVRAALGGDAGGAGEGDADAFASQEAAPADEGDGARSDAMTMDVPPAAELAARCEPAVRPVAALGPLRYVATATWDGAPAVVLGFAAEDEAGDQRVWVYVLAADDCRILNWQRA